MGIELPPLLTLEALSGVRGAPTDQVVLDRLSERIRTICGWHIAPELTETVTLDSYGQDTLPLPTLHLVDVTSVRYWNGSEMVPLDGWDSRTGWSPTSCVIHRPGGFPIGRRAIEVTMVHGYTTVPGAIVDAVADIVGNGRIVQESLAGRSVSFAETAVGWGAVGALSRYRLGPRP